MLYNIVLVSGIHQHESAIGIHMSPPSWSFLSPPTLSHPSRLSQRKKSLFIWQDRSPSGSNKVSHVNPWAGSSLPGCKVREMSGHLRRRSLIARTRRIGVEQWEAFTEGFMESRSLFKCNTVHAILFLLCLLNSRSFCFLSPAQAWTLLLPLLLSSHKFLCSLLSPPLIAGFLLTCGL